MVTGSAGAACAEAPARPVATAAACKNRSVLRLSMLDPYAFAPAYIGAPPVIEPVILLENVDLVLGRGASRVHVLRQVDLAVDPGESIGLVGPSGSGKSTLLMVIAGLERIDSGRVRVAGQDYAGLDEDRLAVFRGRQIGFVFQAFHLMQTRSEEHTSEL